MDPSISLGGGVDLEEPGYASTSSPNMARRNTMVGKNYTLSRKKYLIRGETRRTWGHNFLWARRMDQNLIFDGGDFFFYSFE